MKIIAIVEGKVPENKQADLKSSYVKMVKEGLKIRPQQAFLTQHTNDHEVWRIIGVWNDMETFDKMRESVETPPGIMIFRNAGIEPSLSIYQVVDEI